MKCLTVTQPWATLTAIGAKQIETRSWSVPYRGPLAIHAAKAFPKTAKGICMERVFGETLFSTGYLNGVYEWIKPLPLGCVIATCDLIAVDQFGPWVDERKPMMWRKGKYFYELTDQERAFGDFFVGRYGWFLANVKPLPEPIPAKGMLGLWNWEQEGK
jgi:activating signal cointegrator 1